LLAAHGSVWWRNFSHPWEITSVLKTAIWSSWCQTWTPP